MRRKISGFIALLLVGLLSISIFYSGGSVLERRDKGAQLREDLIVSEPLIAHNYAEFLSFVIKHNIPGSGTAEDPYVISGFLFKGTDLGVAIYLSEIHAYVVIENCVFVLSSETAIEVSYSENIVIRNNEFNVLGTAVRAEDVINLEIRSNNILKASRGIYVRDSKNVSIVENNITVISYLSTPYGIDVINSYYVDVSDNNVVSRVMDTGHGVNTSIPDSGILVIYCFNSSFTRNTIADFSEGLTYYSAKFVNITDNRLIRSGVRIEASKTYLTDFVFENNTINDKLVYYGFNVSDVVVDGSKYSEILLLYSDNVSISGFNGGEDCYHGVKIYQSDNVEIRDSVIGSENTLYGIYLSSSRNISLVNVSITSSYRGIYSYYVYGLDIFDSYIETNSSGYGVESRSSSGLNFTGNVFVGGYYAFKTFWDKNVTFVNNQFYNVSEVSIYGANSIFIDIRDNAFFNSPSFKSFPLSGYEWVSVFQNNTVNGKKIMFYKNVDSVTLSGLDAASVIVYNSSNVVITGNSFSGDYFGVSVLLSENITVRDTTFADNKESVWVSGSDNVVIENVSISKADLYGVSISGGSDVWINASSFRNVSNGIDVNSVSRAYVEDNFFADIDLNAIYVEFSSYLYVRRNVFEDIGHADLYFYRGSHRVVEDNVMCRGIDFRVDSGSAVDEFKFDSFNNNTINGLPIVVVQSISVMINYDVAQVIVVDSLQVVIKEISILGGVIGVFAFKNTRIVVQRTTLRNNDVGVLVYSGTQVELENNWFYDVNDTAIWLYDVESSYVSANVVWSSNYYGFYVDSNGFVEMESNVVYSGVSGVVLSSDSNVTVEENVFFSSEFGLSILGNIVNLTVSGNEFYNTTIYFDQIWDMSDDFFDQLVMTDNEVNGRPFVYLHGASDVVLDSEALGGALIVDSTNVTLRRISFAGKSNFLTVHKSANITVEASVFSGSMLYSALVCLSQSVVFYNNSFTDSAKGLFVYDSMMVNVSANVFDGFSDYAIYLEEASSAFVTNNVFRNETSSWGSFALDSGDNNLFDYNYWSEWTSPDSDGDGIVDVPYGLDGLAENSDLHPRAVETSGSGGTTPGTGGSGGSGDSGEQLGSSTNDLLDNKWVLYGLIGAGSLLVLIGAFIVYRRIKKKRR